MSVQRQDGTPSGSALPLLYAGTVGKRRLSCPLFDSFMFKISSIFIMYFFHIYLHMKLYCITNVSIRSCIFPRSMVS